MSIRVTLPDNSVRELSEPKTVLEFAALIGPRLAQDSVAGIIDGELVDVRTLIEKDCKLSIVTSKDPKSLEVVRHSAAHIMAQAIQRLWPEVKITIGPVIESGFFYDLDTTKTFAPEDLEKIEAEMKKITASNFPIKRENWPVKKAIETFKKMGERFKVEIIEDLVKKDGVTEVGIYHQGDWFDLCRGPHVQSTGFLKAFKLTSVAGAYWRGDEKNPMLQRIYGTAFSNPKDLEQYLFVQEEAKKRDHRKLGKELDLFMFHPWSPAAPFYFPKGTVVFNELSRFVRELYFDTGYSEVITPLIFDQDLFKCSGHYDNYRENMYSAIPDKESASKEDLEHHSMVKAMNCPAHALMFKSTKHSYRELPIRYADFGRLHRYERAGAVHGLARVRSFCQDDAHIFCRMDQLQPEIESFMELLRKVYDTLGFKEFKVFFSTRPEKRLGADEIWDQAESALSEALKELALPFTINAGDGAFYGPKLDIMVTDALGRPWQLGTLQCDFNMANRFELEYMAEDNKPHKPVVLHRAILGSFERFLAVYIEHCAGHFPTWLAPVQVVICNITDAQVDYANELKAALRAKGVRAETDFRNEKLGYKIRDAQMQKIPYMVITGDVEVSTKTLSVRLRNGKEHKGIQNQVFIENLLKEIQGRSLETSSV